MKPMPSSMHIYINGQFLSYPPLDKAIYARELVQAWDNLLYNHEIKQSSVQFEVLHPRLDHYEPNYKVIPRRQIGWFINDWWEQNELPLHSRNSLLFNPCGKGPLNKKKQAVAFHDPLLPDAKASGISKYIYGRNLNFLTQTSKSIFVNNQFIKDELTTLTRINSDIVSVVPCGANRLLKVRPDPSVFLKYNIGQRPFFLAIGDEGADDNLELMVNAVASIQTRKFDVVLIGKRYKSIFPVIQVSDAELKALYQKAVAVVFPAHIESMCLKPLEAMNCGCPVICSNLPSYKEVCGEAALYFDQTRPLDLSEKIITMMIDVSLQRWLMDRGIWHSEKFTWISTAKQILDILLSL